MIASLRGTLTGKHPNQAIVECAGVGYDVTISVPTFSGLPEVGREVSLFVHTHVREDAIALFGFGKMAEKQLFEKLISVSGIGPKLGITILSGMEADQLIAAIQTNNVAALVKVPGIGRKTAERMILELREKLAGMASAPAVATSSVQEDVISALENLGYQRTAAEKAVAHASPTDNFETLFRKALGAVQK